MIQFKNRVNVKQDMIKKTIKKGNKIWILATKTGYCLEFEMYTHQELKRAHKLIFYKLYWIVGYKMKTQTMCTHIIKFPSARRWKVS